MAGGKGGSSPPDLWNQQVAAFIAVQQHMQCSDIGTGSGGQGGLTGPASVCVCCWCPLLVHVVLHPCLTCPAKVRNKKGLEDSNWATVLGTDRMTAAGHARSSERIEIWGR
jgi:hypothetical protein